MQRLVILVLIWVGLAGPLAALEYCDELWFARNAQFHGAGYCFGSPLGAAVFGNEDCTGKEIALSEAATAFVAEIRALETEEGCKVDTTRRQIDVSRVDLRARLQVHPVPDFTESACLGWRHAPLALMAAPMPEGAPLGWVEKGQTLLFQYLDRGDWGFVEALGGNGGNEVTALGWAQIDWSADNCEGFAG